MSTTNVGRMAIFRMVRAATFLALFLVGSGGFVLAQDQPLEAWWVRATFEPTQTVYEGLAATDIDSNWKKIVVLSYDILPPEAQADVQWMHRDGFAFVKEGDFGRKGSRDRALSGVYENQSGEKGRFLLVLAKQEKGTWKKVFLHKEPGEPGFSVLVSNARGLFWGTCMKCGEFSRLRMQKGSFFLEPTE